MNKLVLMQGNEACIEGAIRAGMRFYAGYPITPSTEIAELASVRLPGLGGCFIQMEDEISSIAAVIGASLCGLKAMTATSGPGFSLKQENIGYASMAEVPCVIVDVMRGGPSTGLPTQVSQGDIMQSRWGTHGDHPVIVIAPTTVKDIYYLTIKAFNYSEKYRVPVILLLDEIIAHMRESVDIGDEVIVLKRKRPDAVKNYKPFENNKEGVPPMADFGEGFRCHITGLCHDESGHPANSPEVTEALIKRLHFKIENNRDNITLCREVNTQKCTRLAVALGSTARVCEQVIKDFDSKDTGLFIPYTLWPFPEKELKALVERNNIEAIYVAELNTGQMIYEIERIMSKSCKIYGINKFNGELFTPEEISIGLGRR